MYFANIGDVAVDIDGSGNLDLMKNLTAKAKVADALVNNTAYYETVAIQDGERPDIMSKRLYNDETYHWTFLLLNPQIKNIWDDWPMKYSQLVEYCTEKYQYLAADVSNEYYDITPAVFDFEGNVITAAITGIRGALLNKFKLGETVTGSISNATGKIKEIHVNAGYLVIEKTTGTFAVSGETISGIDTQDNVACNFIKSQAYAPHHHIDDSTGDWVPRRLAGTTPYTYIDYESAVTEQNRNLKVIKPEHIATIANQFIAAMS
jgi:hypothetical protein